jgi:hypothetical protein
MHDPAFPQWMKQVQAMPAEQQIEAVSKKLMELNPGFDGNLSHKLDGNAVAEVQFDTSNSNVVDLSPIRALSELKSLIMNGNSMVAL